MFEIAGNGELLVLDFDTECRPMHYSEWRPESQLTAYAYGFVGQDLIVNRQLRHAESEAQMEQHEREMLALFLDFYSAADVVTGHYIVKHDLPLLVDHCVRLGLPLPEEKLVQDTKLDLPRMKALGQSQDNLATLLRIDAEKHAMNGRKWARANALTAEGREESRVRVVGDVVQHKAIYEELRDRELLSPPRLWKP